MGGRSITPSLHSQMNSETSFLFSIREKVSQHI